MIWIVFIPILREGNGVTAGLFDYCTGALMDSCEREMELKVEKYKGFS